MQAQTEPTRHGDGRQGETTLDPRNAFRIAFSAKEREVVRAQRLALLDTIDGGTIQGSELTSGSLAHASVATGCEAVETSARLHSLEPMVRALAGPHLNVEFDLAEPVPLVRLVPADFDAAILELVANAGAAEARTITVRSRQIGSRIWVMIADDGRGMSSRLLQRAPSGEDAGYTRGAGLSRIRRFANSVHGRLLVHSRSGAGTVVCLNLPTVLKLAAHEPGSFRRHPLKKEKTHAQIRRRATTRRHSRA